MAAGYLQPTAFTPLVAFPVVMFVVAMEAIVVGNVTLDVLCYPVDEVPRHESIAFEQAAVGPGGCASNTAVVLASLGLSTGIAACVGADEAAALARRTWQTFGVDDRFVETVDAPTAVSVGLVDHERQPRFIHTPGANAYLTPTRLRPEAYAKVGAKWLHLAGYFVLPGLLTTALAPVLARAHAVGMRVSLDVVTSPAMDDSAPLWPLLPLLDVFFCNAHEGYRLTGHRDPEDIATALGERGARRVVVKLGAAGAYGWSPDFQGRVPAPEVREAVDATGAGDAFAAGFIAARLRGASFYSALRAGNMTGARAVTALGAIAAFTPPVGA